MNRRNFLKSIATAIIGLTIAPEPTKLFITFVDTSKVGEWEYYVIIYQYMWVNNPKCYAYIDNISIPEGY